MKLRNLYLEASKEDADKAVRKGQEIHDFRKGLDIADNAGKRIKIDPKLFNKDKSEGDRRHDIRSSTKSIKGSVPQVGANPTFSKDADPKAVKKFKKSMRYSDIDIDDTKENIGNNKKADIVADRLKRGKDIPKSLQNKLVKKDDRNIMKDGERYSSSYSRKTFDPDSREFRKIDDTITTLQTTKDPAEYNKSYKKLEKLTGYKKSTSLRPDIKNGSTVEVKNYKSKHRSVVSKDDKLSHTTKADGLKKLYPTVRSSDSFNPVLHNKPRVYFGKNNVVSRLGGEDNSSKVYTAKNLTGKTAHEDPELQGGSAVYVNSKKPIEVKQEK